jgi:hypothetical protein
MRMPLHSYLHDVPARLERIGELVDHLANSVWVTDDESRDRLFTLEAQIWRMAQTVRKAKGGTPTLVRFLEGSLPDVHASVRGCLEQPVCTDDEGILQLLFVASDVHDLMSGLREALRMEGRARPRLQAIGGRS